MAGRWALRIVAALLALLLLAIGLLAWGISLGPATPLIEKQLTRLLDRRVTFAKPPRIQLRGLLRVEVDGLQITGAGDRQALLDLEHAEITMVTTSLLSRQPVIENISIDGLILRERLDVDGKSSFPVVGEDSDDRQDTPDKELRLPIILRHATVQRFHYSRTDLRDESRTDLSVTTLSQRLVDRNHAQLRADGLLQERPWTVALDLRSAQALADRRDLSGEFSATLADLAAHGNFTLPSMSRLDNAELTLGLEGDLPPAITDLSPLLEPHAPMSLQLDVRNIQPGVGFDLSVDFPRIELTARGSVERPLEAEGLELDATLHAGDLNHLLSLAGLGSSETLPVDARLRLRRFGDALTIEDLSVESGAHRVQGKASLPALPSTEGGSLELRGGGPDFSFLQQILGRPRSLSAPYDMSVALVARPSGPELLTSRVDVGEHRLIMSGHLGRIPVLNGSDIEFELAGPDLASIAINVGSQLPATAYRAQGRLSVAENGAVTLRRLSISALQAQLVAQGTLRGHPHYDTIQLQVQLDAPSLSRLGKQFDLKPLGDVPLQAAMTIQGSADELVLEQLRLSADGLQVATDGGALRLNRGAITSDLSLDVSLEELPALLGAYAPADFPWQPLQLRLRPTVDNGRLLLSLDDLRSGAVRGSARVNIASNFQLDAQTSVSTDLHVSSLAELLPAIDGYQPPSRPFSLHASATGLETTPRIDVRLISEGVDLASATVQLPSQRDEPFEATVTAAGDDLRIFGRLATLPDDPLPFRLNATLSGTPGIVTADISSLALGGSSVQGTLSIDRARRSLDANLTVPQADLARWMLKNKDSDNDSDGRRERLIPDTPLPLDLLDDYQLNLQLATGPLGIPDPKYPDFSLVDLLRLRLESGGGAARLQVEELRGSRGRLEGTGTLQRSATGADASLTLSLTELHLGLLSGSRSLARAPRHEVQLALEARGTTVRELAATLDGRLLLTGGPGTLEDSGLRFATESFLSQLVEALLPMLDQPKDIAVECTVLAARAEDGIVHVDPGFVFRSEDLDLTARGKVDLKREQLTVRFDNQARKGLGISAASLVNPYVQITGTLARPRIGLDLTTSAIAGGAAFASGGLTVLAKPLYGRFLRRGNPCEVALKRWEEQQQEPPAAE